MPEKPHIYSVPTAELGVMLRDRGHGAALEELHRRANLGSHQAAYILWHAGIPKR